HRIGGCAIELGAFAAPLDVHQVEPVGVFISLAHQVLQSAHAVAQPHAVELGVDGSVIDRKIGIRLRQIDWKLKMAHVPVSELNWISRAPVRPVRKSLMAQWVSADGSDVSHRHGEHRARIGLWRLGTRTAAAGSCKGGSQQQQSKVYLKVYTMDKHMPDDQIIAEFDAKFQLNQPDRPATSLIAKVAVTCSQFYFGPTCSEFCRNASILTTCRPDGSLVCLDGSMDCLRPPVREAKSVSTTAEAN
uniref:DSL domain-containing protein n=1 Tax=Macrostomum lignano TaxID=282301 RepID=A0A1I8FMX9_9PLAT